MPLEKLRVCLFCGFPKQRLLWWCFIISFCEKKKRFSSLKEPDGQSEENRSSGLNHLNSNLFLSQNDIGIVFEFLL